ncbi:hypothetical protein CPB83DRAFT_771030 [Crepidotus variabilis]|uniref:Histone-lysine N-methyltransferase, H3 lysine-36 specific n=1 Tax=Crepidotus variabilis TaxID=179855 RepID=A0A9P6JMP5_9AGAR|nr:hypothetical protein CPB83DRAFT_771030 [Crepidotus variabilis]
MDIDVKSEADIKHEDIPSPSQSPTLVSDLAGQKCKSSRSPTPPSDTVKQEKGQLSKSSTPPAVAQSKGAKKTPAAPVQLIAELPIAREEALASFHEIRDNNYQFKTLGRSREVLESMSCDCTYEHGVDSEDDACGPYSDCINRLTQVECLPGDCRCRTFCQNQRFQNKQHANIDIVLTEKKGYGLRAEEDFPKDTFIYEYVGDVVNPSSFKRRMREYAEEGIRHFYFMMLQKDEFIDATKSGGIGRFANHSCNPNCYVAKWTIGTHVRMGIFAKRNIQKYEELTFNYNVDRYGHQAQECFCGEPNCVGYIGGKTQTDIVTMDDLYLDALGITDEEDLMALKGTKKKKGKKIDDPDFMPTLKPLGEKEVPKVMQAIRQTPSRKVLLKLLTRIKLTEDQAALRQIMRLRGYSVMTNVLEDHTTDLELISAALDCMSIWPLVNRNKVLDSKVDVQVEACLALDNESIKTLSQKLLDHWNSLPLYKRITKRQIDEAELEALISPTLPEPMARSEPINEVRTGRVFFRPFQPPDPNKKRRTELPPVEMLPRVPVFDRTKALAQKQSVLDIIANAAKVKAEEEEAAAAAVAEATAKEQAALEKAAKRKEKAARKAAMTPQQREALKEKRLLKLIGAVVVKCMSKYAKSLDKDNFKKYAQQLTQVIAEKEKKSSSFRENRLEALSDEKVSKIKKFSKDYIAKVLHKMDKSNKRPRHSASSTKDATPSSSTAMDTPDSNDGVDAIGDSSMRMSLEEAMGMEDEDVDFGTDDEDEVPVASGSASPEKAVAANGTVQEAEDDMDIDDSHHVDNPLRSSDPPPLGVSVMTEE